MPNTSSLLTHHTNVPARLSDGSAAATDRRPAPMVGGGGGLGTTRRVAGRSLRATTTASNESLRAAAHPPPSALPNPHTHQAMMERERPPRTRRDEVGHELEPPSQLHAEALWREPCRAQGKERGTLSVAHVRAIRGRRGEPAVDGRCNARAGGGRARARARRSAKEAGAVAPLPRGTMTLAMHEPLMCA